MGSEDRELVKRILEGDKAAERRFFHLHRDRLYRACVYLLGRESREAEDIVQETFLAAFRRLSAFEFRSSLSHWLVRICMNLCYEHLRRKQRQIIRYEEEMDGLAAGFSVQEDRRREEDARHHRVLQVIETQRAYLGEACRKLLGLRDAEGKSYVQIAETLRVPIGTVMSRLARCKESLKKLVLKALQDGAHV